MIDDMTDQPITVPSGPYFHGTRRRLEIGQELLGGTVDPALGDDRLMVWANTDVRSAFQWAEKRYRELGPTLYVYEVELDEPTIDVNQEQVVTSVMAPRGRVVRLVATMSETPWKERSSENPRTG
jgi:hypothetical protein